MGHAPPPPPSDYASDTFGGPVARGAWLKLSLDAGNSAPPPTPEELMRGNIAYLREKYATNFITFDELQIGLDSVLAGGPVNVPNMEAHAARGCEMCKAALAHRDDPPEASEFDSDTIDRRSP